MEGNKIQIIEDQIIMIFAVNVIIVVIVVMIAVIVVGANNLDQIKK